MKKRNGILGRMGRMGLMGLMGFMGMMMVAACSSDEPGVEQPDRSVIHITLSAPIAETRATYGYNDDKKISLEEGDQLYVSTFWSNDFGTEEWAYTGTLEYVGENTFTGDLHWQRDASSSAEQVQYEGEDIIADATTVQAMLLPKGYGDYGYMDLTAMTGVRPERAFVDGTFSKGVAQLCLDRYTDGGASRPSALPLTPRNAVVCVTVNGLTEGEHNVEFAVGESLTITGTTIADASGTATFSVGVDASPAKADTYTLIVDDTEYDLGEKTLTAGHVYKVNM